MSIIYIIIFFIVKIKKECYAFHVMNTTRDQILRAIKTKGQASIAELAEMFAISVVSVRHHLSALQGDGLVQSAEVRHGVGRPHLVYTLTSAAQERFPAKYVQLSERLLDEIKAASSSPAIAAMFTRMAENVVAEHKASFEGKPLEAKMEVLIEMLGAEGFMAEWNHSGETISLTEHSCPYIHIGQRHPEICALDTTLIRQALSAEVEKTTCVLDGAERCVFVITPKSMPIPLVE